MRDNLSPELAEILREANERGCLIKNHPDLQPKKQNSRFNVQFVAVQSYWNHEAATTTDWRTAKAPELTGYSNPVDDPEYTARIAYKP